MADVTAESVRRAMAEFDDLGREAFLEKYGFGKARDYFLVEGDHRYDSKAIVGAARSFLGLAPLTKDEISGGEDHAAGYLESLGFRVA